MQDVKKTFNIKKVSQIETILKDAEQRVRKIKIISKNEPMNGKMLDFFNDVKKNFTIS